jgi:hypothetical protein
VWEKQRCSILLTCRCCTPSRLPDLRCPLHLQPPSHRPRMYARSEQGGGLPWEMRMPGAKTALRRGALEHP